MQTTVNIYPLILKWKANAQGLAPIGIIIDFNNKRIALEHLKNKRIPPAAWDEKRRQVLSSYPNAGLLNSVGFSIYRLL